MASTLYVVLAASVVYWSASRMSALRANIIQAKKSGFPYLVVPVSPFNRLWQITHKLWVPLIKKLPRSWWEDRLDFMIPDWSWHNNHAVFARIGSETFLVVSPGKVIMFTDSAEAIHTVSTRREHFPKDTTNYTILELFGRNVVTSEGAVWRMHRKIASASFNEKNTALVFGETIRQMQAMITTWMGGAEEEACRTESKPIHTVDHDTMSFALNIIGYVGFGLRLLWPGQQMPANSDPELHKFASRDAPPGHTMNFADSLEQTLEKLFFLLFLPRWLLRALPFEKTRVAYQASENFEQYMMELMAYKTAAFKAHADRETGMDLMGQLVRTKLAAEESKEDGTVTMTDQEIIGNAFIMIVAGHETTANTLHFALLQLAMNPSSQRAVQRDVDLIVGADSDPTDWSYEATITPLLNSAVGAAINELLRLVPSVVEVPKIVTPDRDQLLLVDGEKHHMPHKMSIILVAPAVHRNPRYWPRSAEGAGPDDLDLFRVERWLRKDVNSALQTATSNAMDSEDTDSALDEVARDSAANASSNNSNFFRPPRGAFIPFSDGARSCLGKRIAQVEMVAALAVLFQRYSVELAVDDWASDSEVDAMSDDEKSAVYAKAKDRAERVMSTASTIITLKLHGENHVPIRLVRRGNERFVKTV